MKKQKLSLILKIGIITLVLFTVSGCLPKSTPETAEPEAPSEVQQATPEVAKPATPKLARRPLEFGGTNNKPKFSILSPAGWMKIPDDQAQTQQADILIATITGTQLKDGTYYNTNIMASIAPHSMGEVSIDDYVDNWDSIVSQYFPSVEFINTYQTTINGIDVYVQDRILPRDDGYRIQQSQYVFFIDETYGMLVTGSGLEDEWAQHEAVIKASIETVTKL